MRIAGARPCLVFLVAYAPFLPVELAEQVSTPDVVKAPLPAVVLIKAITPSGDATGSGFLVDPSGTVVTNLHVIQGASAVAVKLSNGDVYDQVRVRAFDHRKDLVIVQLPAYGLPVIDLGDSDGLQVGDPVILVSHLPGTLEGSVSTGVVIGIRAMARGFHVIQTDAAANQGSSGGPVLDAKGRVVGVLSFRLRGTDDLTFVIPINYARGLLAVPDSMSLQEFAKRLGETTDLFGTQARSPLRSRWRSLYSGATKLLRLEGDHLYIEAVLPDDMTKAGGFSLAELTKKGDAFIGVTRNAVPCVYSANDWVALGARQVSNLCRFEYPFELRFVSPTRLEGVTEDYPRGTKFDCQRCSYSRRRVKANFTWIAAP